MRGYVAGILRGVISWIRWRFSESWSWLHRWDDELSSNIWFGRYKIIRGCFQRLMMTSETFLEKISDRNYNFSELKMNSSKGAKFLKGIDLTLLKFLL